MTELRSSSGTDHENRHGAVAHHVFRDASEQEPLQSTSSVASYDDRVGAAPHRFGDDPTGRLFFDDHHAGGPFAEADLPVSSLEGFLRMRAQVGDHGKGFLVHDR